MVSRRVQERRGMMERKGSRREKEGKGGKKTKTPRKDHGGLPDDANILLSYTNRQDGLACLQGKNIPEKDQGLMQVIMVIQMFCDWVGSWVFSRRSQISMYPSSRPIKMTPGLVRDQCPEVYLFGAQLD